jgi:uncharacterized protein (DUF2141 family)
MIRVLKTITIILFLAPLTFLNGQSSITVEIVNLESNKGFVIVDLLDKNEKPVMDTACQIVDHKCTIVFEDLKNDNYAIRYIHDENDNDEFDTNFVGIPKEGFGFSNDAFGKFGPKDFSEWLFDVSGDTKIKMSVRYLF